VLVVEDEALIAMMIAEMLAELGYDSVERASHSAQAFTFIQEQPFDVAILDVNLNGTETFPIADALRQRGVPFIFATGYGAVGIAHRGSDDPVLEKPFTQRQLGQALNAVLGERAVGGTLIASGVGDMGSQRQETKSCP